MPIWENVINKYKSNNTFNAKMHRTPYITRYKIDNLTEISLVLLLACSDWYAVDSSKNSYQKPKTYIHTATPTQIHSTNTENQQTPHCLLWENVCKNFWKRERENMVNECQAHKCYRKIIILLLGRIGPMTVSNQTNSLTIKNISLLILKYHVKFLVQN